MRAISQRAVAVAEQLPLPLPPERNLGDEDFFVDDSNGAAHALLGPAGAISAEGMILIGPEASGKTHLAHIFAAERHGVVMPAERLRGSCLLQVAEAEALVIEDADRPPRDESALFHLLNLWSERPRPLLFTARRPLGAWGLALPDLESRLRRLPVTEIGPPGDGLLRALLVKQFLDRRIGVDVGVIETILARSERSHAAVARLVDALDRMALARRRRVTRSLVTEVLDGLTGEPAG